MKASQTLLALAIVILAVAKSSATTLPLTGVGGVTAFPLSCADVRAYWKCEDTTDSSGNGNTLTVVNSSTFSVGKIGNACYTTQSGSTQKYFTAANSTSLQMGVGQDFSISFWVYEAAISFTHQAIPIDRGNGTTEDNWNFIDQGLLQGTTFYVQWNAVGQTLTSQISAPNIGTKAWHFIV